MPSWPPRSTPFPYTTLFRSGLWTTTRTWVEVAPLPKSSRTELGVKENCQSPGVPEKENVSARSEEHTSELQSHSDLVCRLLLEKKKRREGDRNVLARARTCH